MKQFYFNHQICEALSIGYYNSNSVIVDRDVLLEITKNTWDSDHINRLLSLPKGDHKFVNNGISWWTVYEPSVTDYREDVVIQLDKLDALIHDNFRVADQQDADVAKDIKKLIESIKSKVYKISKHE